MSEPAKQTTDFTITSHPDFDSFSQDELREHIKDLESIITFATNHGADRQFIVWNIQERRLAEAALARRNGEEPNRFQGQLWPEFLTAKEILAAPKDPTRWIVSECLPVGGASVLVAKPKVGKSTIAAALAISVSRGVPWLDRATQTAPVAYVFLDGPLTDIADTFVQLGLRESDPVFIHAGSAPADAIDWILSIVRTKGVKLVIIDVLQKLCRFENINDYSEVTAKMEPLLQAAREGSCHVMTLHHAKKDSHDDLDAAIGSTAIRGLCYTYIFVKRLPETERRVVSSDQRGGRNIPELAVGFGERGLVVQGTRQEAEIDETKPRIRELLETAEGGLLEKEIRAEVQARGIVVSKALREMLKDGEVERTGRGTKGEAFRYHLAASLVNFSSGDGVQGKGFSGIESEKSAQLREKSSGILFPNRAELNGKSTELNGRETALKIFGGRERPDLSRNGEPNA